MGLTWDKYSAIYPFISFVLLSKYLGSYAGAKNKEVKKNYYTGDFFYEDTFSLGFFTFIL